MALFKNKLFSGALFAGALFSGQAPDVPQPEDLPGRAAPSIRKGFESGPEKSDSRDFGNAPAVNALPAGLVNNEVDQGPKPTETGDDAALLIGAGLIAVDLSAPSPLEIFNEPPVTPRAADTGLIADESVTISPPLIAGLSDDEAALLVIILAAEI